MKTSLFAASILFALAGCECGPGVACKLDSDCASGTRCEMLGGKSGYCVVLPVIDAGQLDAGIPDAGAPMATISAALIDFGKVGCGKAPVAKDLDLTNGGTAPLKYTATLSGSPSFTMGTNAGTVPAGMTIKVSITAAALASATAGADQLGVLTVTTDDPALAKVDVPLKLTASGVTLALTPGIASFGLVPVSSTAPAVALTLTNLGNIAATVRLIQPADTQFTGTWTGSPADLTIAPGASAAGLAAGFKPTKTTPSSSSAQLTVTEAVCGSSVTTIPMTGQGTSGSVGISTSDVFFGNSGKVSCGTQAANKTLILSNGGNQAFSWTGTLAKGTASPFTFAPSSGTVPANTGSVTITVTAAAIPAQATTAEEAFGDTLSIVTDAANDSSHPITLHQTASGAVLAFVPGAIDFGTVPVNNTATAPLSVSNEGNAPANISLASSNPSFTVSPAGAVAVAGTSFTAATGTFAPGSSTVQQNGTLAVTVNAADVLCSPLPAAMTMTGIGTNGSVSFTPVALDFGSVNCGATAAAKTVTFSNSGNADYTIVPSLGKGAASAFTFAMSPANGVVAMQGGTVVITVTPKAVPGTSAVTPNLYGDTLTVTSDVSSDSPHLIPLRETARGSIFGISSNSLGFGSVAIGVTASSGFTLSNTGNAQGTLKFLPVQPTIFSMPASVLLSAGASSVENGTFTPAAAMAYSDMAAVSVASGTVLCQPLPFTSIALTGTGTTGNVVALSASELLFGTTACGGDAPPKSFTVTNNSSQTLTFTLTLAKGAGSPYTLSTLGPLAAGAMGTVMVDPKPIPSGNTAASSTADNGFGDALTVAATGGPVNESHPVGLRQTAQGAKLSFTPAAGLTFNASIGGTDTDTFTVDNTGNLAAAYTLTKGGANPGNYAVTPASSSAAVGASTQESVTYTAPLSLGSTSATLTLATSVVRCSPLPAALSLSGSP